MCTGLEVQDREENGDDYIFGREKKGEASGETQTQNGPAVPSAAELRRCDHSVRRASGTLATQGMIIRMYDRIKLFFSTILTIF